ncbi:hypothetical protein L1987_45633 [Smallanthus sonchifolius]|uniref:Uncharacterized protein n=1 Tax=Smallanthus sonchifolius TaxID=185202 RepID=A0ACB9FXC0_9ASTR|nr:hypothetical protein L1987_45633 [Smallanthus sonchifolius]
MLAEAVSDKVGEEVKSAMEMMTSEISCGEFQNLQRGCISTLTLTRSYLCGHGSESGYYSYSATLVRSNLTSSYGFESG